MGLKPPALASRSTPLAKPGDNLQGGHGSIEKTPRQALSSIPDDTAASGSPFDLKGHHSHVRSCPGSLLQPWASLGLGLNFYRVIYQLGNFG